MGNDNKVKIYPLTDFERKWHKITRIILILISLYITKRILSIPSIDRQMVTIKLLWLQYGPLCLALAVGVFGSIPTALRSATMGMDKKGRRCIVDPEESTNLRRLMVPRTKENSSEIQLRLYYLWEGIIILSQIIIIVLLIIYAESSFFDKASTAVCSILMGFIVYVSLTGQGIVVFKGNPKKRKTKGINPTAGMEYVPGVGAYRDANGNYYNVNGVPISTPITVEKKR